MKLSHLSKMRGKRRAAADEQLELGCLGIAYLVNKALLNADPEGRKDNNFRERWKDNQGDLKN